MRFLTRILMSDKNASPSQAGEDQMNKQPNDAVQNESPKPPGLMPKHVQSWVIIGIAVLMLLIMWLTGGKKAPGATRTAAPVVQPPPTLEVNEAKILDLQNRIQELQKEQQAAIVAQQKHLLGALPPDSQPPAHLYAGDAPPPPPPPDPIQVERQRRNYTSLFASNVALSYRKGASGPAPASAADVRDGADVHNPAAVAPAPDLNQLAQLLQVPIPLPPQVSQQPTPSTQSPQSGANNTPPPQPSLTASSVKDAGKAREPNTHVVFEGTVLEAVLINRLDGEFSGPVKCLLTTDLYSHDRQHVLIPAGTKILGEAKRVEAFGQSRLAVIFHRLIMPNGFSVNLDQFKGLNQIGETGLRDKVNNHYARIFGASLAIGALGGVAQIGTGNAFTQSGTDRMREGVGQSLAQSSERILDKFLNILPTLTIREGHRVKVYLAGDLFLPEYQAVATSPNF
jgi:type IV secretory pathway VirB10-like protein